MTTAVWDLKSQLKDLQTQDVLSQAPTGDWFDCLLAEYILSEGRYPLNAAATLERYKVRTLEELADRQSEALKKQPQLSSLFFDIELPLAKVLYQMEQRGISIDQLALTRFGQQLTELTNACVAEITRLIKVPINLNSPSQIGNVLVAQFKVPLPKTPSGQYATNEHILQQFRTDFPIIQHLLTYRELTKLQNTYVTGLLKKIGPDGRIHTTYNQSAVITGRLSSSNPNLQNIPVSSELGKQIKTCFVASPDMTLVSFDYSQQELRILAHMSEDQTLLDAFKEGKDIHKVTAAQIFNIDYDAVSKKQRSAAKTINFGIVYGMSSFGLSQQLQISVEEASIFIDQFYANFPGIKQFFDRLLNEGKKQNYITTILGRRRYVFSDAQRNFIDNNTRRELINFPIQGSAADFIKKAMVEIDKQILQKRDDMHLLLQIHDELLFEIKNNDVKQLSKIVKHIHEIMSHIYTLDVPMDVDIKKGQRWGAMEEFLPDL